MSFDRVGFNDWMQETFAPDRFSWDIIGNIVDYGIKHQNASKDQLCHFLSDLIPIGFHEAAGFASDDMLTSQGIIEKASFWADQPEENRQMSTNSCKWKNFGDINFLEEGGVMVRRVWDEKTIKKYPNLADEYNAFCLYRIPENENYVLAYMKMICVNGFDEEKKQCIREIYGEIEREEEWAYMIADFLGLEPGIDESSSGKMYSEERDYIISKEEAAKWMMREGIPLKAR